MITALVGHAAATRATALLAAQQCSSAIVLGQRGTTHWRRGEEVLLPYTTGRALECLPTVLREHRPRLIVMLELPALLEHYAGRSVVHGATLVELRRSEAIYHEAERIAAITRQGYRRLGRDQEVELVVTSVPERSGVVELIADRLHTP